MMWRMQRTFLLTAWAILFAHSVVPHMHDAQTELEVCATENQQESNLLDFLGHIFHFSTGEDHLEEYTAGTQSLKLLMPEQLHAQFAENGCCQPLVLSAAEICLKNHFRYRPLRAPPSYS
jgi:hypothetical protein